MVPLRKLLDRIRWDPRFGQGRFAIGYYDRIERRIRVVTLESIRFPPDAPAMFDIWDESGAAHRIPLHRVRRVYRNGRVIWARQPPGEAQTDAG